MTREPNKPIDIDLLIHTRWISDEKLTREYIKESINENKYFVSEDFIKAVSEKKKSLVESSEKLFFSSIFLSFCVLQISFSIEAPDSLSLFGASVKLTSISKIGIILLSLLLSALLSIKSIEATNIDMIIDIISEEKFPKAKDIYTARFSIFPASAFLLKQRETNYIRTKISRTIFFLTFFPYFLSILSIILIYIAMTGIGYAILILDVLKSSPPLYAYILIFVFILFHASSFLYSMSSRIPVKRRNYTCISYFVKLNEDFPSARIENYQKALTRAEQLKNSEHLS